MSIRLWIAQVPKRLATPFACVLTLLLCAPGAGVAQSKAAPVSSDDALKEVIAEEGTSSEDVVIDGQKILTIYQAIGSYTQKERADRITERILAVAKNRTIPPDSVGAVPRDAWTEISTGDTILLLVTNEDATIAGMPRAQLAAMDVEGIRQGIQTYRGNHSWSAIAKDIGFALLATLLLFPVGWIVKKLRAFFRGRLEKLHQKLAGSGEKKTTVQVAGTYTVSLVLALGTMLRWLWWIAIANVYVTVVLSFFPQTQSVSHAVTGWTVDALRSLGRATVGYLPSLFVIAVVLLAASQVFRLIDVIFSEIGKGNLSIRGFDPEWAAPTARLIRVMVIALVIVVIFPYLPGSKSPAFQGVSIFAGVLLTLGSSSAVANAIAGMILTYMRALSVGDWVKIGDVVGEVEERSMLVTRILTQKQETITIPNATVMNGSVTNFTREAKNTGVIFHTTVTIGYDAPWRQVHQLLMDAAAATEHVLRNPAPFVLQTQLNDFYATYELNAYTDVPQEMQFIYSDLHQNIQDKFNEAGVEICSPHFAALRDGNTIAIPEKYVHRSYVSPAFRVGVETKAGEATANSK